MVVETGSINRDTAASMTTHPRLVDGARTILDAAMALFSREGFEAVSISQIAERAKVSKANIFHHFRSKEALYIDVIREASIGHAEIAERLLNEDLSSAEKLRQLALWEFEDSYRNDGRVRMLINEVFGSSCVEVHQLARQVFRRNFEAVIGLFEQGQQRGEFRKDFDPAVAACMLGSTSTMYVQTREGLRQFAQFRFTDDPTGFAEETCNLLLASVCVNAPTPGKPALRPKAASISKKASSKKMTQKPSRSPKKS
jgi:TetR/AcrR family transcriptional regulator